MRWNTPVGGGGGADRGGGAARPPPPRATTGEGRVADEADPAAAANEICMRASADPCAARDSSIEQGQPIYRNTLWNVRVRGNAPGGATSRVQAAAERCHAFNN